ncbi:MAG: hypothetical protein KA354_19795 [Phycisphaerae bacterium]|nr:hypothetical protein [Phycisphaerae bacterium]
MTDWRLQGQEKYLRGMALCKKTYATYREGWEHEHCEFCRAKFSGCEGDLHEGYVSPDGYYWVCETCYADFRELFGWPG